jgi:hypothetical protein
VAGLVARGHTNQEIANEMQISAKTVEWSLTMVYRKLSVRSRTEFAVAVASLHDRPPGQPHPKGRPVMNSFRNRLAASLTLPALSSGTRRGLGPLVSLRRRCLLLRRHRPVQRLPPERRRHYNAKENLLHLDGTYSFTPPGHNE